MSTTSETQQLCDQFRADFKTLRDEIGKVIVGNDDKGQGGKSSSAFTYACRPPGVHHGPFTSKNGCLLYEIHYYETSGRETGWK